MRRHRRQRNWYNVKEDMALAMQAKGLAVKQDDGQWKVLCHPSVLWAAAIERNEMTTDKEI